MDPHDAEHTLGSNTFCFCEVLWAELLVCVISLDQGAC